MMLCENKPLQVIQIALLYAKDFTGIRDVDESSILMNLIQNPPEPHEITIAVKKRNECAVIPTISFFMKG